jgi:hypothetical protein
MDEPVEAFLADVLGPCGRRGAIPECLLFGTPIEPDDAVFLKASAAKRVHHCDLPKGRMIDLRRQ